MSSDQERGTKIAQDANKNGAQIDFNKLNSGERDAALAEQKRIQSQKNS